MARSIRSLCPQTERRSAAPTLREGEGQAAGTPIEGAPLRGPVHDTIGNAWYAKTLCLEPAGITSVIVVTSDYHIERSRVIFEWVLGPRYTVGCAAAPSGLSPDEREQRDAFETMLTEFVRTRLVAQIPAGDDAAIASFIENEHRALLFGAGTRDDG